MSLGRISASRKNKLCRTESCVSCRLIATYDDCLHQDTWTWSGLLGVVLELFIRFFYDHHKDLGQRVTFYRDHAAVWSFFALSILPTQPRRATRCASPTSDSVAPTSSLTELLDTTKCLLEKQSASAKMTTDVCYLQILRETPSFPMEVQW